MIQQQVLQVRISRSRIQSTYKFLIKIPLHPALKLLVQVEEIYKAVYLEACMD
jgi:hypothetical protein